MYCFCQRPWNAIPGQWLGAGGDRPPPVWRHSQTRHAPISQRMVTWLNYVFIHLQTPYQIVRSVSKLLPAKSIKILLWPGNLLDLIQSSRFGVHKNKGTFRDVWSPPPLRNRVFIIRYMFMVPFYRDAAFLCHKLLIRVPRYLQLTINCDRFLKGWHGCIWSLNDRICNCDPITYFILKFNS